MNLTIEKDVTAKARALGINMSQVAEEAIALAAKLERNRLWREEHKDALAEYQERIERDGLALEKYRLF
ncbi:MAG: type II toxin-antitoxin system CcdA family antitoxin [Pseudomonadota bacterium]